jgi:hypothetical protein
MQDRRVDRADLQLDRARVAEFLGERDLVPAKRGLPMSTVNVPSGFFQVEEAGTVSKVSRSLPVSSAISEATQRMPLPQAPASEPSLLKMRTRESVSRGRGG